MCGRAHGLLCAVRHLRSRPPSSHTWTDPGAGSAGGARHQKPSESVDAQLPLQIAKEKCRDALVHTQAGERPESGEPASESERGAKKFPPNRSRDTGLTSSAIAQSPLLHLSCAALMAFVRRLESAGKYSLFHCAAGSTRVSNYQLSRSMPDAIRPAAIEMRTRLSAILIFCFTNSVSTNYGELDRALQLIIRMRGRAQQRGCARAILYVITYCRSTLWQKLHLTNRSPQQFARVAVVSAMLGSLEARKRRGSRAHEWTVYPHRAHGREACSRARARCLHRREPSRVVHRLCSDGRRVWRN